VDGEVKDRWHLPGTPLVDGALQTGHEIRTDGWPGSSLVLRRGDMIRFPQHSKEVFYVLQDVNSSAEGKAVVTIERALTKKDRIFNNAIIEGVLIPGAWPTA